MSENSVAKIPIKVVSGMVDETISNAKRFTSESSSNATADKEKPLASDENKVDLELKQQPLIEFPGRAKAVLLLLFILFIGIGSIYFWAISTQQAPSWLAPVMTILWLIAGMGGLLLFYWMWRQFSRFSNDLSIWANQLLEGDFASRMPVKTERCLSKGIRRHINKIASDYEILSNLQKKRLSRQKAHIEQKKHYLSVLYDVASCINKSQNL